MAGVRTLVDPSVQGNLDKVHALPVLAVDFIDLPHRRVEVAV
jgi:hypothetical protein